MQRGTDPRTDEEGRDRPEDRSAVWVAQTASVAGDVAANVARHVACLEVVRRAGGGVVVFPELSLTGYEPDLARELALEPDDPRLDPLARCVREGRIAAVVGLPVAQSGGPPLLGALALRADGSRELYAKVHLGAFEPGDVPVGCTRPTPEPEVFAPGRSERVFRLVGVPTALAICADAGRPEHARRARESGARRYLVGAFALPADVPREHARLADRARTHRMLVAFANHGGETGGLPAGGRSAIWSESGEALVELPAAPNAPLLGCVEPAGAGRRGRVVRVPGS